MYRLTGNMSVNGWIHRYYVLQEFIVTRLGLMHQFMQPLFYNISLYSFLNIKKNKKCEGLCQHSHKTFSMLLFQDLHFYSY